MKDYRDILDNLDSMRINNTDQNYEKMARRASKSLAEYEINTISSSRDIGKLFGAGSGNISREFKKSVDSVEKALNELSKVFEKSSKDAASFEQKKEAVQKAILELDKQEVARRRRQAQFEGRMGTIKGWGGVFSSIGESISAGSEFALNRQTQRHQSIKYMNDVYIGGEHARDSLNYLGLRRYEAYTSKEATDFGKSVGYSRMIGEGFKNLASIGVGAAQTFMMGSLVGTPILGGITAGASAVGGIVNAVGGGVFDSAKYARQARTEKAETIIEANRLQWELLDQPKWETGLSAFRYEEFMGRKGLSKVFGEDPDLYTDWATDASGKKYHTGIRTGIKNKRDKAESKLEQINKNKSMSLPFSIEQRSMAGMLIGLAKSSIFSIKDMITNESGETQDVITTTQRDLRLRNQDTNFSKLLKQVGWGFGTSEKMLNEMGMSSGFGRLGASDMVGLSAVSAMSRGFVTSGSHYNQLSGTIAPFASDTSGVLNQLLNQFGRTPEMNQAAIQYITKLSGYSASRGIDIGADAGILLRSAMNKAGKDWTMQDVQRAASAISSVDEKLTNGQLDMGKVMASGTLSRLGVDGMAQARLFQLNSAEIASLQRAAEKGEGAFKKRAGEFGIYGVSHQQWKEGGISSTLVGGSYTTAAMFMGASGNVQALLGMRGSISAKEAEGIFDSMSDREKNMLYQITGQMGVGDAIRATVTGEVSKGSDLGKAMAPGSKWDKEKTDSFRSKMGDTVKKAAKEMGLKWDEADFDEMFTAASVNFDKLTQKERFEYLKAAKEAADKTFGIVNVNVMTVTSFNPK
jgi:hypothetical protein